MAPKPNLIFIFPDQLGAHFLPSYGNEFVIAPNLSAFAEQGLQFNRTYTSCPLCTPYRGILFTGRYLHQTGVTQNGYRIPSGERVLATMLNEAGYRTSYVGKWHLSGQGKGLVSGLHGGGRTNHRVPIDRSWAPPDQRAGFTEFVGWESHQSDQRSGGVWEDDPCRRIPFRCFRRARLHAQMSDL